MLVDESGMLFKLIILFLVIGNIHKQLNLYWAFYLSGDESDVAFDSGSSSDESDSNEQDNSKVDEQFRKKVKEALGNAAEISDAVSLIFY